MRILAWLVFLSATSLPLGCSGEDSNEDTSTRVALQNDFNNPSLAMMPPWTICESYYGGAEFGAIGLGETSDALEVSPGLGYVHMVAAWDDPTCTTENCLPIASRQEEEVVPGQSRTIALNAPNHQGPCPPEGVEPIPQELYDRILELWPDYGFMPYDQRAENPECLAN